MADKNVVEGTSIPKRFTVYASRGIATALEAVLPADPEERSQQSRADRLTVICDRYMAMARYSMPSLTAKEWLGLIDAHNGGARDLNRPESAAGSLSFKMQDAHEYENTAARHGYDGDALVKKIEQMTFAERIAILEVTDRFWAGDKINISVEERLRACGARVAAE